jgi:hypothetical protein
MNTEKDRKREIDSIDCVEEPTFPESGVCIIKYRARIWSGYYQRMVEISNDNALCDSPYKAWKYAAFFQR